MAKLNETAFDAKPDMLARNDADPELTRWGGHVVRSNESSQPARRKVGRARMFERAAADGEVSRHCLDAILIV